MTLPNRIDLARSAYARAVSAARDRNAPATWRRLVRAGQNLRDALDEQASAVRATQLSVLLVDDDPETRDALRQLLERSGLRVFDAEHGRAALDLLRQGRLRPHAIVLDLELPVMTGWELRGELLRDPALARIPVIVVSGSQAPAPPSVRRIDKPIEPAALVEAIRRARP